MVNMGEYLPQKGKGHENIECRNGFTFEPSNDYTRLGIPLNTFPNKPWFLRVCSIGLLKIL